jgi:hypothetical protein
MSKGKNSRCPRIEQKAFHRPEALGENRALLKRNLSYT